MGALLLRAYFAAMFGYFAAGCYGEAHDYTDGANIWIAVAGAACAISLCIALSGRRQ